MYNYFACSRPVSKTCLLATIMEGIFRSFDYNERGQELSEASIPV